MEEIIMNELMQIFKDSRFGEIRTLKDEDGEVWFVAVDLCKILQHTNPSKALKDNVDELDIKSVRASYVDNSQKRKNNLLNFVNGGNYYE